jgi:acyl-CoA thioester hydrolase
MSTDDSKPAAPKRRKRVAKPKAEPQPPAVKTEPPPERATRASRVTKEKAAAAPVPADATGATPTLLLRTVLDVRWGDMDAFNHVNNATFLSYLEEARLRWLQALPGPWLDDNTAPLLAAAHVNYRRPIEWPATLAIELYADRVGSSSLTIGHRIMASDDATVLYSDGHSVMVWIDRRSGKASSLPAAVRAATGG